MAAHEAHGATLGAAVLAIARNAIARELGRDTAGEPFHPALTRPAATFVTLHERGALRGCIGRLEAERSLEDDVRDNALAAAFRDPRFEPVRRDEFDGLEIEVSVLDAPERIRAAREDEVIRALRPGEDGVILAWHGRRATFLPQVWASLREPSAFLRALKLKAGLQADFWAPDIEVWRYGVEAYTEGGHA